MSAIPNLSRTFGKNFITNPPLVSVLDVAESERALRLFRSGLDNVQIASRLAFTPAAAANGIASARDAERGQ